MSFNDLSLHDNHIIQNLETAKQVPYTLFFIYLFLLVYLSIQYHCIKKNIAKQQETWRFSNSVMSCYH